MSFYELKTSKTRRCTFSGVIWSIKFIDDLVTLVN